MREREFLLDVSRLVWRLWRGRLPTGVDRVCLAYLEHFKRRSLAVVQRKGRVFILGETDSDALFDLLRRGPIGFRSKLVRLGFRASVRARREPPAERLIYLNVGHTGLDHPGVGAWIANTRTRAIFLIHDIIPVAHPEYCRAGERTKHERRLINVFNCAAGVIGNSEATIRDLQAFASLHQLPVPPAVTAWIAGPELPTGVAPKHFGRPHFVTVGTIEARKNHRLLLEVWSKLAAGKPNAVPLLVIVGQRGWEADDTFRMLDHDERVRGHVLELSHCADDELLGIIKGARALLMPSFAEGFGLPVVEALELGTPVIANDLQVFREFAGDIPTYVPADDEERWQEAVECFTKDTADRDRQLSMLRSYEAPKWSDHFKTIDEWIKTLPK